MKIKGLPKLILERLEDGSIPRAELQKTFGTSAKLAIASLSARHLVECELVNGIPTICITDLGKEQIIPSAKFCSACGCIPCDCSWGNY